MNWDEGSCSRESALGLASDGVHDLGENTEGNDAQTDSKHDERDADYLPVRPTELGGSGT